MFEIENTPLILRTPKTPEKNRANVKRWRLANLERALERVRFWRKVNAEKNRNRVRKWRAEHPNLTTAIRHNYRARKRGNGGSYTASEWQALKERYGNQCLWCKEEKRLVPDHVIPLSKNGRNDINNLQPLCEDCNGRKGNKFIDFRPR